MELKSAGSDVLRILVIDDDDLDRLAVRRCLHQCGVPAKADDAGSVAETLERLRSTRYDCILLDYYLPEVSGLVLLHDIRDAAPETPVVIFTGRGDEEIAVELMKAGAADYLPKASLTPERLASGIRHALEVTRTEQARQRVETLLRLLSDAAQHLLAAADPHELMRGLFEKIRGPLGVDAYSNYLIDEAQGGLRLASYGGIPEGAAPPAASPAAGPFVSAVAAAQRQPIHATYIQQSEDPMVRLAKPLGIRAAFCHPLLAEYRLLGVVGFASRTKDEFTDEEIQFLKTVSHYVTAAYERLQHIQRLREGDRRKDEFLATLSHELRDPLAPLRNMLEVAKRADTDADARRAAHAGMERQLGQLEHLVDDLLDVSRITQSRMTLRKRRVELAPLVQQAVETAATLVERRGHDLRVVLPPEPTYLDADPVRLAQVFGNLLTNACKYTERRGRIVLTAELAGDFVTVSVKDTGIGIPPEKLATVFEMFSQIQSAIERSDGGLGIGLTLVRRLVEMHGGTVEARSEGLGRGSEFVVRLPVLLEAPLPESAAQVEPPAAATARRIVVVDDNRDSADSLAMLLETMGHETHTAYDGMAALEAAERIKPELLLLDIGLPKLNGYDVCRRLREQPWGRQIIVVALTGWGQDEDRRKSRDAGFDHHVIKPVAYASLVELVADPAAYKSSRKPS